MSIRGGYLKDNPQLTNKRKFSDKRRKRKVIVTVHRHVPFPHYYVSLNEEDNPLWDPVENNWTLCWDDDEGRGWFTTKKFDTIAEARKYVEQIMRLKRFSNHRFDTEDFEESLKWYYKEGD